MKKLLLSLLLVGVSFMVGCGSGSGSGGSSGGGGSTVTLVSISVTPATSSIAPNQTQQFKAIGSYSDGTTKDLTATATWSASAGASIAAGGLATGVTPGATSTITAISGTISGTASLAVTNPLVSIAVTPSSASVAPNGTQQLTATGTYTDGSTQNITNSVTWSASVGATVTSGGLATGVTPNTTSTIMATQGNISGTATLTITNPLVSIAVTAPLLSIAPTTTVQFTATGTYADHSTQNITSTVIWASSNTTVATISNAPGTQGLAGGLASGTTSITATLGSVTSPPATLTVTSATLVSIAVTPPNPAIVFQTQQPFTATGTFSDSTTQNITDTVTWSSSDTTKITITVSGVATGVGTTSSPVTISATQNGITGSTTATVVPPPVVSIAITPITSASDPTKLAMGTSRRYKAAATLANGSTLNVTGLATWQSNNPSIATVSAGLVAAASTVSTTTPVTISATYNGVPGSINLDVTNATVTSITVTPIAPTIPAGVQQQFVATATFSDGTTQDVSLNATWGSSNTSVATVNAVGVAFAVSSSTTPVSISAGFGGHTGTAQLTVDTATLQSIAVTPAQTTLAPASTIDYQAVGHYSDGSTPYISSLVTWASTNSSVVSIVPGGIATGQSAGTANITATYQSVTSNSAGVLVTSSPLKSIAITPSAATTYEDVSLQFTAIGTFANPSVPPQDLTTNVTWASSQPSFATIGNAPGQPGLTTGVAPGQTSITAVFAGIVSNPAATLAVSNATLVSIAVTPSNPTVTHGNAQQFTATGTFSDSSTIILTGQVTWTSSVATVATINSSGSASTVSPGTTVITATFIQNGVTVTGMTNLTVQ